MPATNPGLRPADLPYLDVKEAFGAVGDGVADDTAAFNAAITAINAASGNAVLFVPAGTYLVTAGLNTIANNGTHILGAGAYATTIMFSPSADASLFTFSRSSLVLYNCSLTKMAVLSSDTDYNKTAVNLQDTSQFSIDDLLVEIVGQDSTGVLLAGRETTRIYKSRILAPIPIRISKNPNTNGWLSADHLAIRDVYLTLADNVDQALPKACILVDDVCHISNMIVDGGAWVGGDYGLYMEQATSPGGVSYNIELRQVRHEQSLGGGQSIHIVAPSSAPAQGVVLNGVYLAADCSGVYARYLTSLNIRDSTFVSYPDSIDINTSVQEFMWENTKFGLGAGMSMPNMKLREAAFWRPDEDRPRNARYSPWFGDVQDIGSNFWGSYEWAWAGNIGSYAGVNLPCVNDQWDESNKTFIAKVARIDVSVSNSTLCEAGSWVAGQSGGTSSKGVRLIFGTAGCTEVYGDDGKLGVEASGTSALNSNIKVINRLGSAVDAVIRVHWYAE